VLSDLGNDVLLSFVLPQVRQEGNQNKYRVGNRVARFFVAQYTKMGENIPNCQNLDQITAK
jgi:hypothetical protein